MAKVSFSFLTFLFLYSLVLFAHPTTSEVLLCPPNICIKSPTVNTQRGDDDDCRLVRPPSLCWKKQQVNFVQSLITPITSISDQIKSQLPLTKEANMIAALTSCAAYYTDALRTLLSVGDKLKRGEKVEWIAVALGLYTDISSCQKAISDIGNPKSNVDFSGVGNVLDVLRKIILGF